MWQAWSFLTFSHASKRVEYAIRGKHGMLRHAMTLYTPQSTPHTPHFTIYTPHFTLYTLHSTLHTLHSMFYTSGHALLFPLHTLHSTFHNFHVTLHMYTPYFTPYSLHPTPSALHFALHTVHSTQHFACQPLPHSTVYSALVWKQGINVQDCSNNKLVPHKYSA